jgi:hypothetical protein
VFSLLLGVAGASGCGGDDGPIVLVFEAGTDAPEISDATVSDGNSAADSFGDAGGADTGGGEDALPDTLGTFDAANDAGAEADASDAACSFPGEACSYIGTRALCNASLVCAPCRDPSVDGDAGNDDLLCASAYGGVELCVAGVCIPGNCRTQQDCRTTSAPFCGAHFCGGCTFDTQCANATPPFCYYTTGSDGGAGGGYCSSGPPSCGDAGDNSPCPANPGDVCCGGVCAPGNCCSADGGNAFCQTKGAPLCSSNVCTTCAPSNGTDYYVDPVNGDDATGTGGLALGDGGASTGCAFKTITRALAMIPDPALPGTRIIILGPSTLGAGETIPMLLRANIVLTTQGGAVTLNIPDVANARAGVLLAGVGAGIQGGAGAPFTIAGTNDPNNVNGSSPVAGVLVGGLTNDTTFLENLTIRDFAGTGIQVNSQLTIREGVVSTGAQANGLRVAVHATIAVPFGQTPTSFSANRRVGLSTSRTIILYGTGIEIVGHGAITLTGVPGATAGSGTVVTNSNAVDGVVFAASPSGPPPQSVVDGLVSYGNGDASWLQAHVGSQSAGIYISAISNVRLRNSVVLGNAGYGVTVLPIFPALPDGGDDISHIDLGTMNPLDGGGADWGHNTFQGLPDAGQNAFAGICLGLDPGSGTLAAAGNTFAGPRDCSGASPGAVTASRGQCAGGVDVGIVPNGGIADAAAYDGNGYAGNDIDVSNCTK